MKFSDFGLSDPMLDGLRDVGFTTATKIQEESIKPILEGKDIIASSETGTGKTGAFIIPVLEKLIHDKKPGVRCLILTPTRELANQIDEQVTIVGYYSGVSSATVFGGTDGTEFNLQKQSVSNNGANIIIATPGRLLDHIKMKHTDFTNLDFLILDEADRMLDMGFIPDVKKILSELPTERQNILFSATIPDTLNSLFTSITKDAVRIDCTVQRTAKNITQKAYFLFEEDKSEVIAQLLSKDEVSSAIVFTKTKRDADQLFRELQRKNIKVGCIHGNREQEEREQTLNDFKSDKINVVVATDVLARGIDIDEVSHVFNYAVPFEAEDYIHRVGRTARADASGTAITLVSPKEIRSYRKIRQHIKTGIEELFPDVAHIDELKEHFNLNQKRKNAKSPNARKSSNRQSNSKTKKSNKVENRKTTNNQSKVDSVKTKKVKRSNSENTSIKRSVSSIQISKQSNKTQTSNQKRSSNGIRRSSDKPKIQDPRKLDLSSPKIDTNEKTKSDSIFTKIKSIFGRK